MKFLKENRIGLVLFLLMAAVSAASYSSLPETLATKFDWYGKPTVWSSRDSVALMMPLVYVGLVLFVGLVVRLSPKEFSAPQSRSGLDRVLGAIGVFLLSIHIGLIAQSAAGISFIRIFSFGTALMLILLGTVFGKLERNYMIGIRVPWALFSDKNWSATHKFAGQMMIVCGTLLLIVTPFYASMPLAIAALMIPSLTPVVYSYHFFRNRELE
jgi:uncharacterized membrane protein